MAGMLSAMGENAMVPPPPLSPPSAAADSVLSPEPASLPSAAEVSPPHAARKREASHGDRREGDPAGLGGCVHGVSWLSRWSGAACAVGHTKHRRRAIRNPDRRDARHRRRLLSAPPAGAPSVAGVGGPPTHVVDLVRKPHGLRRQRHLDRRARQGGRRPRRDREAHPALARRGGQPSSTRPTRTRPSPGVFRLFEIYADEDAYAAHGASEHFKQYAPRAGHPGARQPRARVLRDHRLSAP